MFTPGDIAAKRVNLSLVPRKELYKGESIVLRENNEP